MSPQPPSARFGPDRSVPVSAVPPQNAPADPTVGEPGAEPSSPDTAVSALRSGIGALRRALGRAAGWGRSLAGVLSVVTTTGWACLVLLAATAVAGAHLGWQEAWSAAAVLALLVGTSWLWLLSRGGHEASLETLEARVTVGDNAAIYLTVRNPTSRPLLPTRMEMAVGPGTAVFAVPTLRPGAQDERGFVLPTGRRGVVTVGPVVSVSSDPVGMLRLVRMRTRAQQVHIHPRTVRTRGALHGVMKDVEGAVTQELSSSEVSFHALRDYVPGDDRRNIHWRTTARTGRLMVRQFEETHRSSLLVLLDINTRNYETAEDFETAVSVACSVALDAIADGRQVQLLTQNDTLPVSSFTRLLDASCEVDLDDVEDCDELAREGCVLHPEASVLVMVTGQGVEDPVLSRMRTLTPVDIVTITLRCGSRPLGRRVLRSMPVLDIDRIENLPRVLRRAM